MKRLWTTLKYTFASQRWQSLGWGIGLALYGVLIVPMFGIYSQQQEQLIQMVENYPPEFMAFFGGNVASIVTPAGFLGMYAFSMMPLILGIFAVMAGSGLIINDEERGRLDLIIAHPVGRTAFFFGRFLGLLGTCLSIMILGWLGFCLLLGNSGMNVSWLQMAIPFLSLFAQVMFFTTLALLFSFIFPARSLAGALGGVLMVSSYVVSSLASVNDNLIKFVDYVPYHYFQTVLTIEEFNFGWFLGMLGISLIFVLLAWWRFVRRDIRLSGEGSWQLPNLFRKNKIA